MQTGNAQNSYIIIKSSPHIGNDGEHSLANIHIGEEVVVKTVYTDYQWQVESMRQTLRYVRKNNPSQFVRVISFNMREKTYCPHNKRHYRFAYSYTMPRLLPLSRHEKNVIHIATNVDDMWDTTANSKVDYKRRFSHEEGVAILNEEEECNSLLIQFLYQKPAIRDYFYDLHEENVMKDPEGNYKLIDLEAFELDRYLQGQ